MYDTNKKIVEFKLLEVVRVERIDHFLKNINKVASPIGICGLREGGQCTLLECSAYGRRAGTYRVLLRAAAVPRSL